MEHDTDEDASISVLDDAFTRSKLPTPAPLPEEPLGSDSWDMWVNHMLMRAGITVDRVHGYPGIWKRGRYPNAHVGSDRLPAAHRQGHAE